MALVLGIDSSTQSCKAVLVDAATGHVVDEGRASHPSGTEVDPAAWIEALDIATEGLLGRADAVSIAGQQHGMVALDAHGDLVRPALLWNDTRSAQAARDLNEEIGGTDVAVDATGSVYLASITATKLRWMRDHEPDNARRTAAVLLPHDYLTWHLLGKKRMVTDHGDASGTGYYSTRYRAWRPDLVELAFGRGVTLPDLLGPNEVAGRTSSGVLVAPGTGDNAAAALGLSLKPGDVSVSIGTSGVASATVDDSVHDPSGLVTGFADATGAYLPLSCTLNGARVLELGRRILGVEWEEFDRLALASDPGSAGLVLQPYLDGERTPNRPGATGVLAGLTSATTREDFARATVEGLLSSMDDAVTALVDATGVPAKRILLIGGGARSEAVRQIAPEVFGTDVVIPEPAEYVALGAARQAAWVLSGSGKPPTWDIAGSTTMSRQRNDEIAVRYARLREATRDWCNP
ncbi:Xylulose kinase [Corynebacterium faecale]|uniref:xylulokinase n=1 Tax=Corynebacterium faecale TaxID=1758466 RepID=UPI0025B38CE8|nr:xylulokinase [Corynebacterium faecale]WJY90963.1 Xylulose kinase [Corynebacterium faecale]